MTAGRRLLTADRRPLTADCWLLTILRAGKQRKSDHNQRQ
jgi:hypothetical protein